MSNVENRPFIIMTPPQIPQKLDPILCVWSNYESKGEEEKVITGMTYDYHVAHVIGDGLLHSTLLQNYRDRQGEFRMMATEYVVDINRENA